MDRSNYDQDRSDHQSKIKTDKVDRQISQPENMDRRNGINHSFRQNSSIKCWYCSKIGHSIRVCKQRMFDDQKSLRAQGRTERIYGSCSSCGAFDHEKRNCPNVTQIYYARSRNNSVSSGSSYQPQSNSRFKTRCAICKRNNHKSEDCWFKNAVYDPNRFCAL